MGRALIVSAGASSNEYISARLAELGYARPLIVPSGAEARRRMLESDFELIVVNAPLPDEFGHELCSSAVEKRMRAWCFWSRQPPPNSCWPP